MKKSYAHWMVWSVCALLLTQPLGCTRLKTDTVPSPHETAPMPGAARFADEPAAGVTFSAFKNVSDAKSRTTFEGEVLTQLWLLRDGRRELVHRDYASTWSATDLIAGDYELEVLELYSGGRAFPPNDENVVSFTLVPNSTMQVNLIVRQVPWGAVAVVTIAAVLVVGLVVYAIVAEDSPDLGPLRLPGHIAARHVNFHVPSVRLPPLRWHGAINVEVSPSFPLDLFFDGLGALEPYSPPTFTAPPDSPYVATIRSPACGERTTPIAVTFSEEMNPFYVGPDTIRLFREDGQPIVGGVVYDSASQKAVFYPLRSLERAHYKLVVLGSLMLNYANRPMKENTSLIFSYCLN